jgi:hypothetical protein
MTGETSVADNRAKDCLIRWLPSRREVAMSSFAPLPVLVIPGNSVACDQQFERRKNGQAITFGIAELMWALGSWVAR